MEFDKSLIFFSILQYTVKQQIIKLISWRNVKCLEI
jgi:hypothetical protein